MGQVTRREAIANFLLAKTHKDLAELYTPQMEVQCNVAQGTGERVDGEYMGKSWSGWTDGTITWKSFRIPFNANTKPTYEDQRMSFDLVKYAEGIGMTGWDFVDKVRPTSTQASLRRNYKRCKMRPATSLG
jgi:hypothetical protein